ncbi:cytochrome b/b6 domain-containing protein [Thiotrichales bacterium 19S11-10]|nr:cytochrome b/b6 domain-containing protein [Thiotrichales bacterium 19S11-10]
MKHPISIRILHFLLILIIFAQILIGYGFDAIFAPISAKDFMIIHKSLGLLGLVVAILLLLRRLFYKRPPYPTSIHKHQIYFAKFIHFLLYLSVIIMGLSGYVASLLFNKPLDWFYMIQLPQIVNPNPSLGSQVFPFHIYGAIALSILVGLHVLGALYHAFKKDGITRAMF